jgi:type IX secretion system PorP/SprF family membrane protein
MMRKLITIGLVLGGLLTANIGSAQDIHFSQFYMSPLNLNPAMTGVMNCKMRFTTNFRNQWAPVLKDAAFNTFSASYDQKVPVGRYDYVGFGGTMWGDKAGSLDFSTLALKLSFAYSKRMGGTRTSAQYLVLGADGGVNQRSVNFQNAKWGSQAVGGVHRPELDPGEPLIDESFMFGDLSAGVLWFNILDEENNFYLGAAFHHLNQANQSFYSNSIAELYTKTTLHAGGEFRMSDRVRLVPGIVTFLQGPSLEVNGGTSFRFLLGNSRFYNQSFQAGAWVRLANRYIAPETVDGESGTGILADAIILSTRFDYENFGIGFSYDINVSSLAADQSNGAFEFSLIYNICGPERRGVYCPNF